jgi:hypothetical protein
MEKLILAIGQTSIILQIEFHWIIFSVNGIGMWIPTLPILEGLPKNLGNL